MMLTPTGRIRQGPPMQNIPVRTTEGAHIRAALIAKLEEERPQKEGPQSGPLKW